jgi:hypothetical protein
MWFEAVQAVGRLKDVVLCATLNPAIPGSNGTDGKIRYFSRNQVNVSHKNSYFYKEQP